MLVLMISVLDHPVEIEKFNLVHLQLISIGTEQRLNFCQLSVKLKHL